MLEFSKEEAIEAAEQYLSGLARYAECFFGEGAAARLLAIPPEEIRPPFELFELRNENEPHADPANFKEFDFPKTIARLYDFAAYGLAHSITEINDDLNEGSPFWEVFGFKGHFVDRMANDLIRSDFIEKIDKIYKAAEARAYMVPDHPYRDAIRLECLAALAGVSVKTLRNAASNSGKNQLKTIKSDSSTVVLPEDALEWLRGRPGFKETRIGDTPQMESYLTIEQLGLHITTLCQYSNKSVEQAADEAGLEDSVIAEITNLSTCSKIGVISDIDAKNLYALASQMGLNEPKHFAIEAIKIIASHNATQIALQQLS